MYVTVNDKVYTIKQIERNKKHSEEFDGEAKVDKPPKIYISPMSHPWKRQSFEAEQKRAHQSRIYTG